MSTLPEVRVGDPICHESLAVFPLFSTARASVDYLLSDEAIQAGSVAVEEAPVILQHRNAFLGSKLAQILLGAEWPCENGPAILG